jgi:integrase
MEIGCVNISIRRSYLMGTIFHLKKEGKPDKDGNPRGCWRYEDKQHGIRDTFNESFAHQIKKLREGGVTLPFEDIVDQLLELNKEDKLHDTTTVREFVAIYQEKKLQDYVDKPRVERKIKGYRKALKVFLSNFVDMYGGKRLSDVTPEDIRKYYLQRRMVVRKLNAGSRNLMVDSVCRELGMINTMYRYAIRFGHYKGVSPVEVFGIPYENRQRNRVLSTEEEVRLLLACEKHGVDLRDLVILLLYTGMRLNEALSLEWLWVDLEKRVINLPEFITKNGKPRSVRLCQACVSLLRERKFSTGSIYAFPSETSATGHRVNVYRQWRATLKESNITDLRLHDLRHTCASRMKEIKADASAVQTQLGHSSFLTTQRYVHVENSVQEAIDLLGFTYFDVKKGEKAG